MLVPAGHEAVSYDAQRIGCWRTGSCVYHTQTAGERVGEVRIVRHSAGEIDRTPEELRARLGDRIDGAGGRVATDKELAEHLGIDVETLWRWQADTENAVHVPLEHTTTDGDGNTQHVIEPLTNESEPQVDEEISRQQEYEILRSSLTTLKEQERIVLTLYYFEELKLHEIADVLELTESRVSQIRAKALGKLRVELAGFRQRVA
jgi:RNA polymerase sigma factor for flagellar operon FliA